MCFVKVLYKEFKMSINNNLLLKLSLEIFDFKLLM